MKRKVIRGLFFLLWAIMFFSAGVQFQNVAEAKSFYDGKTIVVIVPTNPGGGYDFYSRVVAKLLQEELPGSTVIAKNVPGAGSIIGVNQIFHSKPNGLTFGIINPGLIAAQIFGQTGVRFDLAKMSWLGATGMTPYGLMMASPKFKTFEDVRKADQISLASAGTGTLSNAVPLIVKELGLHDDKLKIMLGYKGTEAELGMMQGNIDGQWAAWGALESFVRDGHATPVLFVGSKPAEYQNVPNLADLVKDAKHAPLIEFMETMAVTLLRGFAGPPNIPQEPLQELRNAFKKVLTGPGYAEIMKKSKQPAGFIDAEKTSALVKNALSLNPELVEIIKRAYGTKKG